MILTLIALWVVCCIIFFGSLAIAASQPLPPIDREALLSDPIYTDTQNAEHEPAYAYSASVQGARSLAQ